MEVHSLAQDNSNRDLIRLSIREITGQLRASGYAQTMREPTLAVIRCWFIAVNKCAFDSVYIVPK